MPNKTKYNLEYRPVSYWGIPQEGDREDGAVTRRPFIDLGRDFLPVRDPDEVEIAGISLASVTGDMIRIRARRGGTRIAYRVVDECGTAFTCAPPQSTQPLSLGELLALIDGATGHLEGAMGLTSAYRDYNLLRCAPEVLVDFVTVTSAFYPELQAYYAEEAREWLAAATGQGSAR